MKISDPRLQRLFRAASLARRELPMSLPAAMQSKVLAHWRGTRADGAFAMPVALFGRAAVFAGVIMVVSVGWNWTLLKSENTAESALADYATTIQMHP